CAARWARLKSAKKPVVNTTGKDMPASGLDSAAFGFWIQTNTPFSLNQLWSLALIQSRNHLIIAGGRACLLSSSPAGDTRNASGGSRRDSSPLNA
ncbi:MAG: hypothetical protein AAFX06_33065, partial [Planctomycetota bacterium]